MKGLYYLKEKDFIAMAKLIDNNFIGNNKIVVGAMQRSIVYVTGHTSGGQCINCQVKFDIGRGKLNGVYTQNEDADIHGSMRHVLPPTFEKVIDYLKDNDFDFCSTDNKKTVARGSR